MRATCAAKNGDPYVKQAEDVTGSIGEPFPTLPACLVTPPADDTRKAVDWAERRYRPLDPKESARLPNGSRIRQQRSEQTEHARDLG
jgi:hypothetical protein